MRASDSLSGPLRVDGTATLGYKHEGLSLGAMAGISVVDRDLGWWAGLGMRWEF